MSTRLATPIKGLDYVSELTVAGIKGQGVSFVLRYLSDYPWKNLTPAEARSLRAGGIGIGTVWENGASDILGGFNLGKQHAQAHRAMARACGKPDGVGAYFFAGDYDTAGNAAASKPYWEGVATEIPREQCGPYGDGELLDFCFGEGFGFGWQALSASGWRGDDHLNQRAQIAQVRNGASVDYDEAYFADFGQWSYFVEPPPPDPDHYERFLADPVTIWKHKYSERAIVEEFDALEPQWRARPIRHAVRHAELHHDMKLLRDRIWHIAHEGNVGQWGLPVEWAPAWRGYRWQQLNARMNDSATIG